ncbi:hypothetical protein RyT2_25240 [Pseudolactococcus yaeyamensis]
MLVNRRSITIGNVTILIASEEKDRSNVNKIVLDETPNKKKLVRLIVSSLKKKSRFNFLANFIIITRVPKHRQAIKKAGGQLIKSCSVLTECQTSFSAEGFKFSFVILIIP